MDIKILIFQILLTIPLTIILSYIENKNKDRINSILIPTIYIILIAALFPSLKQNIFLITIFEVFIRNFYLTTILNKTSNDTKSLIIDNILSMVLSVLTYNYFISQVDLVIPTPESIKPFLWFLLILYVTYLLYIIYKTI